MTDRQIALLGCAAILVGIPLGLMFIHWLIATMPDYALGLGSGLAIWAIITMVRNGGN